MSLRIEQARTEEQLRTTYRMRFDMMCRELAWIPAADHAVPEERDEYDAGQAVAFLAYDDVDSAVGTARFLVPGPIPLPIERHFEIDARPEIETKHGCISLAAEVSRFIVPHHPVYRGHQITMSLCMALLGTLLEQGASHAYISADHRFYRLLQMIGLPFGSIGEAKEYLGSKTVPAIINLPVLAERLRATKPHLHELLMTKGSWSETPARAA